MGGGGTCREQENRTTSSTLFKNELQCKKKQRKKENGVQCHIYDKRLHCGVEYVNLSKLCAPKGFSFLTFAEFLLKGRLTNTTTTNPTIVNRAFSLTWPASLQIYWNKRSRLHKKKVRLPQDRFGYQHGRRFIVLEHQYGRRDVMWKNSIGAFLSLGCSGSGSVIRDHSDHGRSNEPMKPLWTRIHGFIWPTMIQMISDHWSWSGSYQRNVPYICLPKLACEYNRISYLSITDEVSLAKRRGAMKGSSTPKLTRGSTPTLWLESKFLVVGRLSNYDDDEDNFI